MNKEVSFPIAKLLKEKGLDEVSQKWYSVEGSPYYQDELDNHRGFIPAYECEAPTIADVVMWFYEKHRIWIWVGCRELEDGTNKTIFIPQGRTIPSTKKDGFVVDIIPYTPKGSPTEAYEAAIEYTLNNLI